MAEPIPLTLPPRDPRAALYHRLENAPREHVEALLSACDVLQGLHDRGVLEAVRGALGSSDEVLEMLVEASATPPAIRGMRNLLILAKTLGALEPRLLESLPRALEESAAQPKTETPPGLFRLLLKIGSKDSRRALNTLACVLESLGKAMGTKGSP